MAATDWHGFWNSYRKGEATSESDLFIEVGKTVAGRPISREQFGLTVERIVRLLELAPNDKLLELCCGNGLMTRALASVVWQIEAVDFSQHLIEHARGRTKAKNVRYFYAEAVAHLEELLASRRFLPTKVLLGDALAYFEPASFRQMLTQLSRLTNRNFRLLATGVPSDELKWNFYNTPERVAHFEENQRHEENTNDGLGRWWQRAEFEQIATETGVQMQVQSQPASLSNYRVDAVFCCDAAA